MQIECMELEVFEDHSSPSSLPFTSHDCVQFHLFTPMKPTHKRHFTTWSCQSKTTKLFATHVPNKKETIPFTSSQFIAFVKCCIVLILLLNAVVFFQYKLTDMLNICIRRKHCLLLFNCKH